MSEATFVPDMFLKFTGAEGECEVKGYTNTIAVLGYDFSVSGSSTLGHGSGSSGGAGTCNPISLTLVHDKGYAKLRKFAGQGKITSNVVITRTANGNKDEVITLTNAKVIHASDNHGAAAMNTAQIVLAFSVAQVDTYVETDKGVFSIGDTTTFNMTTGVTT